MKVTFAFSTLAVYNGGFEDSFEADAEFKSKVSTFYGTSDFKDFFVEFFKARYPRPYDKDGNIQAPFTVEDANKYGAFCHLRSQNGKPALEVTTPESHAGAKEGKYVVYFDIDGDTWADDYLSIELSLS